MTLTWVICGAGRGVGKTHLAMKLRAVLPEAVYAKQGGGERKAGKAANLLRTKDELTSFIDGARPSHQHIVIESNELAREGEGDVIIFVEGVPKSADYREDVDLLRKRSHVQVRPGSASTEWDEVVRSKLASPALCKKVCDVLAEQQQRSPDAPGLPIRYVDPLRYSTTGAPPVHDPGGVIVEELLTIMIEDVGSFALMCTPCDVEALAVGFAFSEGMISSIDDVIDCSYRPDQRTVGMRLDAPEDAGGSRNLIVTSSCGLCGSRNVDKLLAGGVHSQETLRVSPSVLQRAAAEMYGRQGLFTRTGGTHAAGVFDASGEVIAFAEDIGRHSSLDKAIGKCLMDRLSLDARGAVLSGRVSLELVAKAARAGIEIIAAVSAPSSLAIDAAERCNITLCAFVRRERATAYTHPQRIA